MARAQVSVGNTLQKRTLREWLNAREVDVKEDPVIPPDEPRERLPASRRVPKQRTKT